MKAKEWFLIAIAVVFIVIQVWLDLRLPDYMSEITILVKTGGTMREIWINGGYMMACAGASLVTAIIVCWISAVVGSAFSRRLRSKIFNKVDAFSAGEINKFSTASLITRSTNDITQVQMLVTMAIQILIKSPILAVWAIIKISGKGFEWSVATGVAVSLIMLMITILVIIVMPMFKKIQNLNDNINKVARENLTGIMVVRAYNADAYHEEKFDDANKQLADAHLFTSRAMAFMQPVISFIMMSLPLSIYVIGAIIINQEASPIVRLVTFSNMVVFSAYAMQIIMAFIMVAMMFIFIPRASVSAKRINEVLNTVPSIKNGTVTEGDANRSGEVVFDHVGFRYPGAQDAILHDISFTAQKGQTVAIIGGTGCGKSTLIGLVPRFYDCTSGAILVDGVNVRDYTLEALNNKLGYVPQKAVLFTGSVASNVAYGNNGRGDLTMDNVQRAVKIAQGKNFVEKMEGQYEAEIARGGANISGGQKQRLAIARAVCRQPEIYIFDDSFSALDFKTDRQLRSALKSEISGATCLIVAQRIGTIMDADKIIVLENGKKVGEGTHKELLGNCKVYKEIALSQLSEEELK